MEFAVQLLQLVHGRNDATLRSGNTLDALAALAAGGYVGRTDAAQLDAAYRFLRAMEHRIQLYRLRRTHLVPDEPADLRRLGRSLGLRTDPVAELTRVWKRHGAVVRRLHEKLFYRPLLDAVAQLAPGEIRLSPRAAGQRLEALGYADPAGALRHLEALSSGVSRKAAIQRTLLPVLLGWFADSADPDAGLLGFRKVSDALGKTPGTCGCSGTRVPPPRTSPGSCRPAGSPPTCCCGPRRRSRCSVRAAGSNRAPGRSWSWRSCRPSAAPRPPRALSRPRAGCAAASCSVPRPPTSSARTAPRRTRRNPTPGHWSTGSATPSPI